MKITLPTNKIWKVSYIGELWGQIINAFNLDLFSSQGKVKLSNEMTAHTTSDDVAGLEPPTGFTMANIDDGVAKTKKIWAIAESKKIVHSEGAAKFELETATGLPASEDTSDSDILSVRDDTGETMDLVPVDILGVLPDDIYITGAGDFTKVAQTFKGLGTLKKITLDIKKQGTPTDNFVIKVQEDDEGSPSGVNLATDSVAGADLETTYSTIDFEDLSDADIDVTKTYWLIFERSGASSSTNYFIIKYVSSDDEDTDPYASGEMKTWTGAAWKEWKTEEETDETLPDDDNNVPGETGFTNADVVYNPTWIDNDDVYASAQPNSGVTYSHVWKDFGFSIPTGSIIKKIEVKARTSLNIDDYGSASMDVSLTKNADDIAGSSKSMSTTTVVNTQTIGEASPLWGTTWTAAEINSSNFGVRVDVIGAPDDDLAFRLMYLYVKVYYQEEDTEGENYLDANIKVQTSLPSATDRVFITTTKDVKFLNEEGGNWESLWQGILNQPELNEDYPSILKKWGITETLFLGNENKIHSIAKRALGTDDADIDRIEVSLKYYLKWMVTTKSAVFAGFEDKNSAYLPSIVVYYEPLSETTRAVNIEEGTTVGFGNNENCYLIDIRGQIKQWTGTNFQIIDYLPNYFLGEKVEQLPHRNAFINKDGNIHFLWKGQYPYPAGIWTIEKENGRTYHKNSLGSLEVEDVKALFSTGEEMYAGVESANEDSDNGIFSEGDSVADGYFVTPRFTTKDTEERWQDILIKYDPVKPGVNTGNFKVKYRTERAKVGEGVNADSFSGTWTSATQFTCDDATLISAVDDEYIEIGNEIIIRKGRGAGKLAHITNITGDEDSTKTITIDESLGEETKTFDFSVENWTKINFQDFSNSKFNQKASVKDTKAEWIQFKVAQSGSYELEEIQVLSNVESQIQPR